MAEMEKEGRPPENKRSRKPAHPVKREINEEMKVCVVYAPLSDVRRGKGALGLGWGEALCKPSSPSTPRCMEGYKERISSSFKPETNRMH